MALNRPVLKSNHWNVNPEMSKDNFDAPLSVWYGDDSESIARVRMRV